MLVSVVQQSESVICIHISTLFQIVLLYRSLQNIGQSFLCYTEGSHQLSILYIAVCICESQSASLSLISLSPLVTIISFLHPGLHFSFVNTFICRYHFLKFHLIKEISDDTCLSLSDLLHSAWQSLGPSMPLQMALFCSFSCLNNIQLYIYAISFLSIIPSLDIQVASMSTYCNQCCNEH